MAKRFFGMTNQNLDDRNRFPVPSKFRMGELKDADCIYMLAVLEKHPHIDFFYDTVALDSEIEKRKAALSPNTPGELIDFMFNGCLDLLTLDKQGRTSAINSRYLKDVALDKETVVIGQGDYFSVYGGRTYELMLRQSVSINVEHYDAQIPAVQKDYEKLANGGEGAAQAASEDDHA